MRTFIAFMIVCLVSACGSNQGDSVATNELNNYLEIKDALVSTSAQKAQDAAQKFLDANPAESLKTPLNTIAKSDNVAEQRQAFNELSQKMYAMVSSDNNGEQLVYKQYCPMAFNNTGAYWLSTDKEIMNPYFGDEMLHCGSIQETINQ